MAEMFKEKETNGATQGWPHRKQGDLIQGVWGLRGSQQQGDLGQVGSQKCNTDSGKLGVRKGHQEQGTR